MTSAESILFAIMLMLSMGVNIMLALSLIEAQSATRRVQQRFRKLRRRIFRAGVRETAIREL